MTADACDLELVQDALDWVRHRLAPDLDPMEVKAVVRGPVATTIHLDGQVVIVLVEGAGWWQLRGQAAHEAFHALWERPIYSWVHEMVAEIARAEYTLNGTSGDEVPDGYFEPVMYNAIATAEAASSAAEFSAASLRTCAVPAPEEVFEAFYGRARLLGLQLRELVGLPGLMDLAGAIAAIANCSCQPGTAHTCPHDEVVRAWVAARAQPRAIAALLEL